jgi:hypothetical protein
MVRHFKFGIAVEEVVDKTGGELDAAATMVVNGSGGNNDGTDGTGGHPNAATAIAVSAEMLVHAKYPGASSWTRSAPGRREGGGRRQQGMATAMATVAGADRGPPGVATAVVGGGAIPIGIGATSTIMGGIAVDVPASTSMSFLTSFVA